jgi:hypothetical protein
MVRTQAVPQFLPCSGVLDHFFQEHFVRPTTASKDVLPEDAIKTHDHIAFVLCNDSWSKETEGQKAGGPWPHEAGNSMPVYAWRRRNTKLVTEEVNLVPPLPQPLGRVIENPFRAASKLETLMRQGDFHASVSRQPRLTGLDRIEVLIVMIRLMNQGERG